MKLIASIFSWVFIPLLIPTYCMILTLYTVSFDNFFNGTGSLWSIPNEIKYALLNLYLIFTLIAPGISLLVLRNRKMISTIDIQDRTQRFFPILLMFFYSIALFLLLFLKTKDTTIPHFIFTFPLSGAIVSIALFAANYILKISLHAAGCGIMFGYILAYAIQQQYFEFWILFVPCIISGVTISSRLYLKKHTFEEVSHGWVISSGITFVINLIPF
ncbi:MAG: hypothetical protein ACKO6A_03295 [Bacteroidota bacterium]